MLLSEPLATLITFFRTSLIKIYLNSQRMSDPFCHITESRQTLNCHKLKKFANSNFRYSRNGGKFIDMISKKEGNKKKQKKQNIEEKEKLLVTRNFSFSLNVVVNLYGSQFRYEKCLSHVLRTKKISLLLLFLPHSHTMTPLTHLGNKPFENTVGK